MDCAVCLLLLVISGECARLFCHRDHQMEVGKWKNNLIRLDSAVIENNPVAIAEGQVYVYENDFPGFTITYIHVDNLAVKTCGAKATIKTGGVGFSTVLIILRAEVNNEMRTVVDIWGVKNYVPITARKVPPPAGAKNIKSLYLFKNWRTVNHNVGNKTRLHVY